MDEDYSTIPSQLFLVVLIHLLIILAGENLPGLPRLQITQQWEKPFREKRTIQCKGMWQRYACTEFGFFRQRELMRTEHILCPPSILRLIATAAQTDASSSV